MSQRLPSSTAPVPEPVSAGGRREFLRVRLQEDGTLALFPRQSSAVLSSTVWGDGVVDLAPGQTVARGEQVRYLPFATLWG